MNEKEQILKNVKGTTDYLPKEQIVRKKIMDILEKNFSLFGYLPLESAIICSFDLLASKYAGGAEILKEVYKLTDQGDRELGLRYDLTVPFSKVIGAQKELQLPFRRYEMGKVFRDGPVKVGRAREFYQCDVDICGIKSIECEVEFFTMTKQIFDEIGINIELHWNNRKLIVGIMEYCNVPKDLYSSVILSVDKLEKIGKDNVYKELISKGIEESIIEKVFELLGKDFEFFVNTFKDTEIQVLSEGIKEVSEVQQYITSLNMDYCIFKPFLARGLEIYTGTVWEVFDKKQRVSSSIGAGGRYDKIITNFIDDGNEYPSVGMTFGLEPIYEIVKTMDNFTDNSIDCIIYPFVMNPEIIKVASTLRENGIKVVIDMKGSKLKKTLDFANKNNVPFVIIIGEDEISKKEYTIKNMALSEQETKTLAEIIKDIKNEKV